LLDPDYNAIARPAGADIDPRPAKTDLRLRLLTPLKSQMIERRVDRKPWYHSRITNSAHLLLYPAGTKLEGTVSKAKIR